MRGTGIMKTKSRVIVLGGSLAVAALSFIAMQAASGVQAQDNSQTTITTESQTQAAQETSIRLIEAVSMMGDIAPETVQDQKVLDSNAFQSVLAAKVRDVYADSEFDRVLKEEKAAAQLIHDDPSFKQYESVNLQIEDWQGATINNADGSMVARFTGKLTFHFADHDATESTHDWTVTASGLDSPSGRAKLISYVAAEQT
jgi:hypothetical protein